MILSPEWCIPKGIVLLIVQFLIARPLLAGSETASIPLYPTTGTLSRSDKDPKLLSAIEYLNQIKRAYEGQPQVYSYFLKTIKDFKYQMYVAWH